MDLIETNAKIVRQVTENVAKHAPEAVIIVVLQPAGRDDRADRQGVRVPDRVA